MILAIFSFVIQIVLMTVTNALGSLLQPGFALFVMIAIPICTLISILCIIYNALRIRNPFVSKGVSVTGLVFSIVGTVLGSIFSITAIATLLILL